MLCKRSPGGTEACTPDSFLKRWMSVEHSRTYLGVILDIFYIGIMYLFDDHNIFLTFLGRFFCIFINTNTVIFEGLNELLTRSSCSCQTKSNDFKSKQKTWKRCWSLMSFLIFVYATPHFQINNFWDNHGRPVRITWMVKSNNLLQFTMYLCIIPIAL